MPIFGRFGQLLCEIASRFSAEVITVETEWGTVFDTQHIVDAVRKHRAKLVALVQGDTSTTVLQPLAELGPAYRAEGALMYVDATASICGNPRETDLWCLDAVSCGLQNCMSGPPGVAPITFNERVAESIKQRKHTEDGFRPEGFVEADGPRIASNCFDLGKLWIIGARNA